MKINSISVVVLAREDQSASVMEKTLSLWTTNLAGYRDGAELILVDMTKTPDFEEFVNGTLTELESAWLRVVYFKSDKVIGKALNEALSYSEADHFLILDAAAYPVGNILEHVEDRIDNRTVVSGIRSWVKAVYNHSFVRDEYRSFSTEYTSMDASRWPWKGVALETLMVPTEFLRKVSGFSDEMDDDDFVAQEIVALAKAHGYTMLPLPELHVMHVGPFERHEPSVEVEEAIARLSGKYANSKFDRRLTITRKTKAAK